MQTISKILMGLFLALFMTGSYAITVNVQSSRDNVQALGFTVRHGGLGSSYQSSGMPTGKYAFGVRAHGRDIACYANNKRTVYLNQSANVTLSYSGRHCMARLAN
jgi:hypothetical protein